MSDQNINNQTNAQEEIIDITLDPNKVQEAMSNEIGILSGELVCAKLKISTLLAHVNTLSKANEHLRAKVLSQTETITALQFQVAGPNHPLKRKKCKE